MRKKKLSILLVLTLAGISLGWGSGQDPQTVRKDEASREARQTREARLERLKMQQRLPQLRREAAARFKQQRAQALGRELARVKREATPSGIPDLGPLGAPYIFWPFVSPESGPMVAADPAAGTAAAAPGAPMPLADPRGIPHYFGPIPNYANSPLPRGSITAINLVAAGSGYLNPAVIIEDAYFTGTGATATAVWNATGGIDSIAVTNPGSN